MIENNRFSFDSVLIDEAKRKYDDFIMECEKVSCPTAIGGRYSFVVTPTSIGTIIEVTDSVTKKTLDLTDYTKW